MREIIQGAYFLLRLCHARARAGYVRGRRAGRAYLLSKRKNEKCRKTRVASMRATGRVSMRVARGRANGMIGQTIMQKRARGNG